MGAVKAETAERGEPAARAGEPPLRPLTFPQWTVSIILGCFFLLLSALAVRHV
jgi:hypothetical protein